MAPASISHYRILKKLDSGGMGVVFEAEDVRLGRRVALKFLPDALANDPQARSRLQREARAASALNHPNICTIFDIGDEDGQSFIAMELLRGTTLKQRIESQPLHLEELLDLGIQITDALEAAHAAGVIHRDLKPSNLFITQRGQAKILDFGVAKQVFKREHAGTSAATLDETHLTAPGAAVGTIGYMSPEQARGEDLDARSDIFSLGMVLYEMATGNQPFPGTTSAIIFDGILNRHPPRLRQVKPELPIQLEEIIQRAMEKSPEARFQSAAEMKERLLLLREGAGQPVQPQAGDRKNLWKTAAGLLVFAAFLLGAALFYRSHRTPKLSDKDTIVIGDFANSTGDAVFDGTLKQALGVSLLQSPFLNVLSDSKVAATLRLMAQPPNTPLTPEVARELCQRANSKAYIAGSVASLGSAYIIGLKAVNCISGDTLAQEQAQATGKENVLDALSAAATRVREKLGESLASVQKFNVPLSLATTRSLEALKTYTLAFQALSHDGSATALPMLKHAVELDPDFATALYAMGVCYSNLGQDDRASEFLSKAFALRNRASERERLNISYEYYQTVTGEFDKAIEISREYNVNYPRSAAMHLNVGSLYSMEGKYDQAVAETQEALRLSPNYAIAYDNLVVLLLAQNRFSDAHEAFADAQARKLNDTLMHKGIYALDFIQGDAAGMSDQVAWYASQADVNNEMLGLQSDTEAYAGHLKKARSLTQQAMDSALRADNKNSALDWQARGAWREAAFGNLDVARREAASLAKIAPDGSDAQVLAALTLATTGETSGAKELAEALNKHYPSHTMIQLYQLPTINAAIALQDKHPEEAIELLRATSPAELGLVNTPSCMYPTYVRGEALLASGQGEAAAAEFQKFIDHRGIVWNCPTGALAHLQLGRSYRLAGEKDKALSSYHDFLELWKDADADIPILKQAKAEFSGLQ